MSSTMLRNAMKVLCEACLQGVGPTCPICSGAKYYYWNPQSQLCYDVSGNVMQAHNADGELVDVIRPLPSFLPENDRPVTETIAAIQRWVSEDAVRSWKVTCSEEGWHSCLWHNRYKRKCCESSAATFAECANKAFADISSTTVKRPRARKKPPPRA